MTALNKPKGIKEVSPFTIYANVLKTNKANKKLSTYWQNITKHKSNVDKIRLDLAIIKDGILYKRHPLNPEAYNL